VTKNKEKAGKKGHPATRQKTEREEWIVGSKAKKKKKKGGGGKKQKKKKKKKRERGIVGKKEKKKKKKRRMVIMQWTMKINHEEAKRELGKPGAYKQK